MAGDPARTQRQPRGTDARAAPDEWYVVTSDGTSALRIAAGLTVGESAGGALALDDPHAANQWITFDIGEDGHPTVAIATRNKSLMVGGATRMRYTLDAGATVKLPGNNLYISRDIRLPATSGTVVEVVQRQVPGRPQDLVGPGWQEALRAVEEGRAPEADPQPTRSHPESSQPEASPAKPVEQELPGERQQPRESAATAAAPDADHPSRAGPQAPGQPAGAFAHDDPDLTIPEPPRHRRRRSRRQRQSPNLALYAAAGVLVLALGVALVTGLGWRTAEQTSEPLAAPPVPTSPDDNADAFSDSPGPPPPASEPRPGESVAGTAEAAPPGEAPGQPSEPADTANSGGEAPPIAARAAEPTRAPPQEGATAAAARASEVSTPQEPVAGAEPSEAERAAPGANEARAEGIAGTTEEAPASPADGSVDGRATTASEPELEWRLIRARELMENGYFTYPPEDNAVAYIERLLAADPDNPRALTLLEECASRLIDAAVRAHDQGLEFQARNTLEEVLGFAPDHEEANRLWVQWVSSAR